MIEINQPPIIGATKLLGIVGHPIAQVKAPQVWTELFRRNGLNIVCVPLHVLPEDFDEMMASMKCVQNLSGLIVTIPHKPGAVSHADTLSERAQLVQSVNFLSRQEDGKWIGDIFDGVGFVGNLVKNDCDPKGKRTLVVGTGGVGTAIAFALAEHGVSELTLYDADQERCKAIAQRIRQTGVNAQFGPPDPSGFDVVVNATPVGMKSDDPLPIDASKIKPDAIVADVIVEWTRLLELAKEKGCKAVNGVGMMNNQLAAMADALGLSDADFSFEHADSVSENLARMCDDLKT